MNITITNEQLFKCLSKREQERIINEPKLERQRIIKSMEKAQEKFRASIYFNGWIYALEGKYRNNQGNLIYK